MTKPKPHGLPSFAKRAPMGHHIDRLANAGKHDEVGNMMRESERVLTLERRRIGEELIKERDASRRQELQDQMDELNTVLGDLCFNIRDPQGYCAKHMTK
jgi:hypothetical protein